MRQFCACCLVARASVNVFVVGNNLGTGWGESVDVDSQGINFVDFVAECMDLLM